LILNFSFPSSATPLGNAGFAKLRFAYKKGNAMRLLKRVNTLVTAQLHEVVECFEKPERILKQTIRDMEDTLQKVTESTARAIAAEKQLRRRLDESKAGADSWRDRAREAIKKGDEPGARMALARRIQLEKGTAALTAHLAQCEKSNARLRSQLDQLRNRLMAAKGEMGALVARQRFADAQRQIAKARGVTAVDTEPFEYFDEMSRRVAEAEAEAEALCELRGEEQVDVVPNQDIEHELHLLKAECEAAK
jgi:phage shock protein A